MKNRIFISLAVVTLLFGATEIFGKEAKREAAAAAKTNVEKTAVVRKLKVIEYHPKTENKAKDGGKSGEAAVVRKLEVIEYHPKQTENK